MSTQNAQPKYFNLHTSGIGYLSDIREIAVKKLLKLRKKSWFPL